MNIKEAVLAEHSKAQALRITNYIGNSPKRFAKLMECFFANEWRLNQCAAYSMNFVVEKNPHLFDPYLEQAIHNLKAPKHDAVKRNTLRILQTHQVPEDLQGTLLNLAFDFLASPKEPIAIKVFSMGIIFEMGKKEPDLFHELKVLIEDQLPTGSSGFKARGKKYLKYINKVIPSLD